MTTIQTDQGETVHAIGAPGSIARVRIEHPKLIERLNALYNSEGNIADAVTMIREAGIRSEMETNNLLAVSHFGDCPSPVTSLVYSVARSNLRLFCDTYRYYLAKAHNDYPQEYCWPREQLQTVGDKMCAAIERGSYNKDSRAFRDTCRELNIKHTYTAINAFIKA